MSDEMNSNFFPFFWFTYLFGEQEIPSEIDKLFAFQENADTITITDKKSKRVFQCGNLVERDFNSFQPQEKKGGGKLNIICGCGEYSSPPQFVDFLTAYDFEDYEGATFQIPSSSFCTQNKDSSTPPKIGITNYIFDPNQGVLGAVAAAPASIYRNYKSSEHTNLLSNLPFHTSNGYIQIDTDKEIQCLESLSFDWTNTDSRCKIGVQRNNEVLIRRDPFNYHMYQVSSKPHKIHQIFCVRLNFIEDIIPCPFTKDIAFHLLESQYKMTIKAAWENSVLFPNNHGSKILYLVPLGYESGTSLKVIARSIEACADLIVDSGLDVFLSCPTKYSFDKCQKVLKHVVEETGGKIIMTKKVSVRNLSDLIETVHLTKIVKWFCLIIVLFSSILLLDRINHHK